MSKHTEGPWLTLQMPGVEQSHAIIDDFENRLIAIIIPRSHYTESDGNARIMASAPELLEALELALKGIRHIIRQIPNDEGLADWDFSVVEVAELKAQLLITKLT